MCFRSVTPSKNAGVATQPLVTLNASKISDWLELDNRYFNRDQFPNWDISYQDQTKCLNGEIADRICSAFEKKSTAGALAQHGVLLEMQAFEQLMSNLYRPRELDPSDEVGDQTSLRLDDRACAAWLSLKNEGKQPNPTEVARRLKCSRTALYRLPNFLSLLKLNQEEADERKRRLPKGYRHDESGRVEAWQDAFEADE
jgi:hypothetical protein